MQPLTLTGVRLLTLEGNPEGRATIVGVFYPAMQLLGQAAYQSEPIAFPPLAPHLTAHTGSIVRDLQLVNPFVGLLQNDHQLRGFRVKPILKGICDQLIHDQSEGDRGIDTKRAKYRTTPAFRTLMIVAVPLTLERKVDGVEY